MHPACYVFLNSSTLAGPRWGQKILIVYSPDASGCTTTTTGCSDHIRLAWFRWRKSSSTGGCGVTKFGAVVQLNNQEDRWLQAASSPKPVFAYLHCHGDASVQALFTNPCLQHGTERPIMLRAHEINSTSNACLWKEHLLTNFNRFRLCYAFLCTLLVLPHHYLTIHWHVSSCL